MNNLQHLIHAYKHLSLISLSGVFDFDTIILSAKKKLIDAIITCVSDDDFISHLNKL